MSNTTLQGWGRGTWNQGAWGSPIAVEVAGLVGTTGLGTPDGIPGVNVGATGLSATTSISQTGASTVTYAVTVVGGNPSNHPNYGVGSANKYAIDGSTATADVVLTLYEGNTYRFDQSDATNDGHPLRFTADARAMQNVASSSLTQYTTGVTTNGTAGQAGAYTEITVADGAPTLYYYCTNHSAMGATLNTHGIPNILTTTGAPTTGLVATTALGSESIFTTTSVAVTTTALTLSQGNVAIVPEGVVFISGVSATGFIGAEQVYSLIRPDQVANWVERVA